MRIMKIQTTEDQIRFYSLLSAGLFLMLGGLILPTASAAANISQTTTAGAYTITLKVLPAESFRGPKAEMARDAGAAPIYLTSPAHPNHHMVVFVKKDGRVVEDATVAIRYKRASSRMATWKNLPVVRMHVAGQSLATTHYGNNLKMAPGSYIARVTVEGKNTATFRFSLGG